MFPAVFRRVPPRTERNHPGLSPFCLQRSWGEDEHQPGRPRHLPCSSLCRGAENCWPRELGRNPLPRPDGGARLCLRAGAHSPAVLATPAFVSRSREGKAAGFPPAGSESLLLCCSGTARPPSRAPAAVATQPLAHAGLGRGATANALRAAPAAWQGQRVGRGWSAGSLPKPPRALCVSQGFSPGPRAKRAGAARKLQRGRMLGKPWQRHGAAEPGAALCSIWARGCRVPADGPSPFPKPKRPEVAQHRYWSPGLLAEPGCRPLGGPAAALCAEQMRTDSPARGAAGGLWRRRRFIGSVQGDQGVGEMFSYRLVRPEPRSVPSPAELHARAAPGAGGRLALLRRPSRSSLFISTTALQGRTWHSCSSPGTALRGYGSPPANAEELGSPAAGGLSGRDAPAGSHW